MHNETTYLYLNKVVSNAYVIFDKFPGEKFNIYKIGIAQNVDKRLLQYDMPMMLENIEIIKFPDKYSAETAETMLCRAYSMNTLRKGMGRKSEWFAFNDEQVEHTLEVMRQFKDNDILSGFIKDAPIIRKELNDEWNGILQMCKTWKVSTKRDSQIYWQIPVEIQMSLFGGQ
jgi:hypothetical protein